MHECLKVCCDCKHISGTTWDFKNNLIKINFVYVSVDVSVSVYHHASVRMVMYIHCKLCVLVSANPEEGIRFPGSGDTGHSQGEDMGKESELGPLEEQQEFIVVKPTIQPLGPFAYPSNNKAYI